MVAQVHVGWVHVQLVLGMHPSIPLGSAGHLEPNMYEFRHHFVLVTNYLGFIYQATRHLD